MGRKLIGFLIFFGLSLSVALAQPKFVIETDRGAYLVKAGKKMRLGASITLHLDAGMNKEDYKVILTPPGGKKIEVPFSKNIDDTRGIFGYWLPPVDVQEVLPGRDPAGQYLFTLTDKNENVLASAEDFLIPYAEVAKEEMTYFDPSVVLPKDQTRVGGDKVVFRWNPIKGSNRYFVTIYRGNTCDPNNRAGRLMVRANKAELPTVDLPKGIYCWRLEAIHEENGAKVKNTVLYELDNGQFPVFDLQ